MLYGLRYTGISGQGFWNFHKVTYKSNLFYGALPHRTIQHQLLLVITILPPSFAFPRQRSQGITSQNTAIPSLTKTLIYFVLLKSNVFSTFSFQKVQTDNKHFPANSWQSSFKHYKVILLANSSTKYFLLNWNDPHCKKFWSVNVVDRLPVFAKLRAIHIRILSFK